VSLRPPPPPPRRSPRPRRGPAPRLVALAAAADPVTGQPMNFNRLIAGPDAPLWQQASVEEFDRLMEATHSMHPIPFGDKPAARMATYYNPVCSWKKDAAGNPVARVRGTLGGDRVDYPFKVAAATASLPTIKTFLNAVVSERDTTFHSIDIKDYYLNTELPHPEYVSIRLNQIPAATQLKYGVARFAAGRDRVMFKVTKGMYGLPQAGILAQQRLIAHLAAYGYYPAEHTPALFLHRTRPISFVLIVDDFGVKTRGREHMEHLMGALRALYEIKVDWSGRQFVGLTLDWDYVARSVRLSMPVYIAKTLARFGVSLPAPVRHGPAPYTAPVYGLRVSPLTAAPDESPLLDASATTRVQAAIGTLLFYARAVDPTLLVRLGQLAVHQAKPTQRVAASLQYLLEYAATYPNASIVYYASDMHLYVHSDASYLSESQARSRAGGYHHLSRRRDPSFLNGAVHVLSTILTGVMASAAEAEYGAAFLNACDACPLRVTLAELGYPQGATPLQVDNTCAVGLANDDIKARRTKSIDMRFHWLRYRAADGQYYVFWAPGATNHADFFTKLHPHAHHRRARRFYVRDSSG
jgi:hypothetical protein